MPPASRLRSKDQLRHVQMIYQMADTALNPKPRLRKIIGRPMQFYLGLRGKERKRAFGRSWKKSNSTQISLSTATRLNCRVVRNSGSALPARWPQIPSSSSVTRSQAPLISWSPKASCGF